MPNWKKVITSGSDATLNSLNVNTFVSASSGYFSGSQNVVEILGSGSSSNPTILSVDGSSGRLFEVSDDLSDSLFSINTIAGMPVIEAFATNDVNIGKFPDYPLYVTGSGTQTIATGSFTGSFVGDGSSIINVDAETLDGQNGAYYLNYSNFSNTPTINDNTITINAGNALTGGGNFTLNQGSNEDITVNHADTSTQSSSNNSGRTYIQDVTLDTYGHVTGLSTATETVTNTDTNYYLSNLSFSGGTLTATVNGTTNQSVSLDGRYLQSESDPTVPSHVKSITTTDISQWDTAYSWGDHAQVGYLTSVSQSDVTQHEGALTIEWGQLTGIPTYDNYGGWTLHVDNTNRGNISSGEDVEFIGGNNVNLTYSSTGNKITIDSSYVNTNYYLSGLSFNTSNGELTATVNGTTNQVADLDGRYLQTESDTLQSVTNRGSTTTNNVTVGNLDAADGNFSGNVVVEGNVTAQEFHTEFVSSSIIYESGSTKFGDTADDNHDFTGSLNVDGSLTATNISGNGSGITSVDAETLDGQNGTYYLNYNNFSNTPTIGNGTLTLATSGIATGGDSFSANQTSGTTFTVDVPGTDLSLGGSGNSRVINSSTGNNVSIPTVTTSNAGFMSTGDKSKLNGIENNADNYSSWNLKTNGTQRTTVGSGGDLDIVGGTNVSVGYSAGGIVTISSTDTNDIDYVSNVAIDSNDNLNFTKVGSAFGGSVDLSPYTTNYYVSGLSFGGGILTATVNGTTDQSVNLDGRYLQSESDPTVPSHVKNITTTDISQWDDAYGWGDWSTGVDKSFIDALNVDADTLDGYDATFFTSYTNSRIPSGVTTNGRVATLTTNYNTDINQSSDVAIEWDTPKIVDDGFDHSTSSNPSRLTLNDAGRYQIYISLAYNSSDDRVNPRIRVRKNGSVFLDGEGLTGYIRASSGHNEGSNNLMVVEQFAAGDYIEVITDQIGAAGTCTLRDGQSIFIVEPIQQISAGKIAQFIDSTGGTDLNTNGIVPFDLEVKKDSAFIHSNTSNPSRVEVANTGFYRIAYNVTHNNDDGNNDRVTIRTRIRKNGSTFLDGSGTRTYLRDYAYGEYSHNGTTFVAQLNSGDYIEVYGDRTSGSGGGTFTVANETQLLIEQVEELSSTVVNAEKLDGQNGAYYLNYNNFTNTPTINDNTITINAGNALTGGGNFTLNQGSDEDITVNHADTSTLSGTYGGSNNGIVVEDVTLDGYGHVTDVGTRDLDSRYNNYTHPTFNGDDINVDTGALSGATVISDLDFNITTNNEGHVTDANGTVSTRNLTLGDLGYTGDTNADNYSSWNLKTNGTQRTTVGSGGDLDIVGGSNVSVGYSSGGVVTISSTDTNDIDYVSDVTLSGNILDFTGVGNAFDGSIDLSQYLDNTNYYLSNLSFSGGTLTATVNGTTNQSVSLDGRYPIDAGGAANQITFWQSSNSITGTNDLQWDGNVLSINGVLEASEKSFNIPHPTKKDKRLIYGVLEGPEHGVYCRGKSKEKVINLPEEWTGLVDEDSITVQLTPIGKQITYYVEDIADNKVIVGGSDNYNYFYYIQATRKDVEPLQTER